MRCVIPGIADEVFAMHIIFLPGDSVKNSEKGELASPFLFQGEERSWHGQHRVRVTLDDSLVP
jgi:hypothetical protein